MVEDVWLCLVESHSLPEECATYIPLHISDLWFRMIVNNCKSWLYQTLLSDTLHAQYLPSSLWKLLGHRLFLKIRVCFGACPWILWAWLAPFLLLSDVWRSPMGQLGCQVPFLPWQFIIKCIFMQIIFLEAQSVSGIIAPQKSNAPKPM